MFTVSHYYWTDGRFIVCKEAIGRSPFDCYLAEIIFRCNQCTCTARGLLSCRSEAISIDSTLW